jgi:hypothetical protein
MRALIFAAIVAAGPAVAMELVARQGADEVRIFDGPCIHAGTMALIKPEDRAEFHKATGQFQGKPFYGCWRALPDGSVGVQWEDGDVGHLDRSEFKAPATI